MQGYKTGSDCSDGIRMLLKGKMDNREKTGRMFKHKRGAGCCNPLWQCVAAGGQDAGKVLLAEVISRAG
ncbi:hypothetical protein DCC81_03075 [Chitinophaga parva]|uniref:Uncharacterized protein n=1 Tax=Chitinophaga parva TaxID=2169414 RepID=A0A2T7BLD2_9BACT|nr:hypothetical protein DCC81_03075 [Chitinophaga parva]